MSEAAFNNPASARSTRVREQAARAEELIRQQKNPVPIAGNPNDQPNLVPSPPKPTDAAPVVGDAPVAGPTTPEVVFPAPQEGQPVAPAAVQDAGSSPAALDGANQNSEPAPATLSQGGKLASLTKDELIRQVVTEQQRNSVLQGKYQAEVPRLSDEIREMRGQLKQLREQLAQAQQAPAPGTPAGGPTPPDPRASAIRDSSAFQSHVRDLGLTEDEANDLLQTTLAALPLEQTRTPQDAGVVAPGFGAPPVSAAPSNPNPQAADPTAPASTGGGIPVEQTLREHVDMFLTTGSYDSIGNDEAFLAWLNVSDPRFPGNTRGDAMRGYYKAEDYTRAGMFFQDWARETGYATPAGADPRDALIEPVPHSAPNPQDTIAAPTGETVSRAEMQEHQQRWPDRQYRASQYGLDMQTKIDHAIANGLIR